MTNNNLNSSELAQLAGHAEVLEELHKTFTPHAGQLAPLMDLFFGGVKFIFLCLGRRFGKSALMCYMAVRWALTRPNSTIYIVGPMLNTQREIILHSGLLLGIVPRKYMKEYNKTEGRVYFTNGSWIRVIGADDPDSLRGIKCSLLLIDEIKDIKADVINIITPTLMDQDAPMIVAGTPPEVAEHPFWEKVEEAKTSPDWRFYHGTTYDNPYLKKDVIDRERATYEKRGDNDVFLREFMAQYVPGGKRAVFPMLTEGHIFPYNVLHNRVARNAQQWTYYATLDPGTASCFAVTLHAFNPYKGLLYVMDEVYEQQQAETSIGKLWPRVAAKMRELYVPDFDEAPWHITVDEAATWARNELLDQFHLASFPTSKASSRKADGISLMKDLLRANKLLLSDRCIATRKEMASYMLDKNGYFVKKNDHAIDTIRYTLTAANFTFNKSDAPAPKEPLPDDEKRRAYTIEEDYKEYLGIEDQQDYLLDSVE
jgi:hypothetical protein